jgi:uncharacterized circularly permuted ATP-grasp superfamily protein
MSAAPQHAASGFDEAWAAPGEPRAHYAELMDAFASVDVSLLRGALGFAMSEKGVTFGNHRFEVCPMPRLLTADEAARLATGLEQRVRALNAFVADCYGERRIVAAGRVPEWIIDFSEGYEPALAGRWPGGDAAIAIAGLDLIRTTGGELQVLEDNVRAPSGFAYAISAARAARGAAVRRARARRRRRRAAGGPGGRRARGAAGLPGSGDRRHHQRRAQPGALRACARGGAPRREAAARQRARPRR